MKESTLINKNVFALRCDDLKEELQDDLMAYLMGSPFGPEQLDDICDIIVKRVNEFKKLGV